MKWNTKNRKRYENKGYIFTNLNDEFDVNVKDLPLGSDKKVEYICDYCGKKKQKTYGNYNRSKNGIIKKDCCRDCCFLKFKESNLVVYGVDSTNKIKEVRDKQKKSMMDKYGVFYPMQNESSKIKAKKTLFENNSAPISRQQLYIYSVVSGELNYPVLNYNLDIAFPEDGIYIECNFGGHWLQVKFGNISEEEFKEKEKKRYYALYRRGWKQIKIINHQDKVPDENNILHMLEYAKSYLKKHSWIDFNLDQNKVCGKELCDRFDYGNLHWVYK